MPSILLTRIVSGCPILRASGLCGSRLQPRRKFQAISGALTPDRPLLQRALACAALIFAFAAAAAAGTVTGVIHNGTDGSLAAGVDVILIQLQGGMQPVVNTKTDSKGAYKFDFPAIGQQPMLIRAVYHGVMFHQPLPPGRDKVDVTVYEPSADSKIVNVGSRRNCSVAQRQQFAGRRRRVCAAESVPAHPRLLFQREGRLRILQLPQGAQDGASLFLGDLQACPWCRAPWTRAKANTPSPTPFSPAIIGVRFSYQLPYPSNSRRPCALTFSDYSVGRVTLVAPPSVQIKSEGFTASGTEQGFSLYTRDSVPAGLPFDVSVSGTAPPPQASQNDQQGNDQDPAVNSRANETIQALPNRLDSLRWIIIGGFAALVVIGVLLLWRQPALATAAWSRRPVLCRAPPAQGPRKRKLLPHPNTRKNGVFQEPRVHRPHALRYPHRLRLSPLRPAIAGVESRARSSEQLLDTPKDKLCARTPPPGRHHHRRGLRKRARPHRSNPARTRPRLKPSLVPDESGKSWPARRIGRGICASRQTLRRPLRPPQCLFPSRPMRIMRRAGSVPTAQGNHVTESRRLADPTSSTSGSVHLSGYRRQRRWAQFAR